MTRVIIVRHGESTYNIEKRIQGRSDASELTSKGRQQAAQVKNVLANISFDAVYHSPLRRASQTAAIICDRQPEQNQFPTQKSDLLREIDLTLWEGMLSEEVKTKFSEDYRVWKRTPHRFVMMVPDGSGGIREHFPVLALYQQAERFWRELLAKHRGQTILIVAHNGINRALISTALGIEPSRYHSLQQSNCGISVLNFTGGFGETVQLESMNQTQHLGETLPSLRPKHRGIRILLVRHGETEWNRKGQFQGQIDIPLNDNGRAQAAKAQKFLQDTPIDFAVTSPMARPRETAEIILQSHPGVELDFHPGLKEISHGLWEGKFEAEIEQEFPGDLELWRTVPEQVQMPEGENLQQVFQRATAAWQDIIHQAIAQQKQTGLVVAHDATNKTLICHLLGLTGKNFWNFRQGNGAVTVIDYPAGLDGLPVLQAMNITSHLTGSIFDRTAAGAL